ncbi:hypothetical protein BN1007_180041 [Klebsiella variicola]|nr:hypothetical protein BN1007_180041 [Klebsiella variicola]
MKVNVFLFSIQALSTNINQVVFIQTHQQLYINTYLQYQGCFVFSIKEIGNNFNSKISNTLNCITANPFSLQALTRF